jgi:hypothetical protein
MTWGEIAFSAVVIGELVSFTVTLTWVTWWTNRKPAQPSIAQKSRDDHRAFGSAD